MMVLLDAGLQALQGMLRRMQDSETGRQILQDKPRVTVCILYLVQCNQTVFESSSGETVLSIFTPST